MNFLGDSQCSNLRVSKSHNAVSEKYTESAFLVGLLPILPILFSFPSLHNIYRKDRQIFIFLSFLIP